MNEFAIEITNLSKVFYPAKSLSQVIINLLGRRKSVTAVDSINLRIKHGELFVLMGSNGAGKTTLIKIITGLILPSQGTAIVNGCDVVRKEITVKKFIGLATGEERSFYWRLTGRQNMEFFAALHDIKRKEAKKIIDDLMALLDIKDPDKKFQEYSTGIKQRFSIARSLLNDPKVIFMDEPTKNLDPLSAESIRTFIKKELVENRKKTVIFCTHNLSEAVMLGDRIAIMDSGRVKACDSLEGLRRGASLGQETRLEEVFKYYVNK